MDDELSAAETLFELIAQTVGTGLRRLPRHKLGVVQPFPVNRATRRTAGVPCETGGSVIPLMTTVTAAIDSDHRENPLAARFWDGSALIVQILDDVGGLNFPATGVALHGRFAPIDTV